MSVITSKESKTFKDLQRLTQKKYRDREGLFIAEGPNVVGEAISQDGIEVLRVFAREGSGYEGYTNDTVVLSDKLFDTVSDTVTSQGVIAVLRKPDRGTAADVLKRLSEGIKVSGASKCIKVSGASKCIKVSGASKCIKVSGASKCIKTPGASGGIKNSGASDGPGDVIVLDRLQDPGNIGTILRTAEGAGIKAAIFIKGTCDPFSPKVVRACVGSILRMPIAFCDSAEEFIKIAADTGCKLAVTDVRNGVPYYRAGLSRTQKMQNGDMLNGDDKPNGDRSGCDEQISDRSGCVDQISDRSGCDEQISDRSGCVESACGTARQYPIALVIGNEGNGVSETFLDAADILVNIPMQGKLESLNASVAAALLMYEMSRPE